MSDWPDLAVLDLLAATARSGSLSAAARDLGLAQPNASRAVRRMERRTGVELLVRTHSGSALTPAGEQLVAAGEPLLAAARKWRRDVEGLRQQVGSRLSMAASQTVAEYLAPQWLAQLRGKVPGLEVQMHVTNSRTVAALVATREAAVGFIESPDVPPGLESRVVHTDRLCVVVAPTHRWARRRRPLALAELVTASLVVREQGSGTRDTLDAALTAHLAQSAPHPALVLSSNTAVLGACAAGAGPAVLSELAVQQALAAGTVRRVELAEPDVVSRQLRAVWTGQLEPLAADLVRLARGPGGA